MCGRWLVYNQCGGTPYRDEYILTIQLNSVERSGRVAPWRDYQYKQLDMGTWGDWINKW